MSPGLRAAGALVAGTLAASCTFTRTEVVDCRSNAECRSEFGVGFVCNGDQLCEAAAPTARCTQTYPEDLFESRAEDRDRILFGNLMDRSVESHVARERSARLAYQQANQEMGLDGREFGAIFCNIDQDPAIDDLTRSEAAVESARFLTDVIGVPAILGPAASTDTEQVFNALAGKGVLLISPSATSPTLTGLDPVVVSDDQPGLLWRTCPSDRFQGQVIASDMLDRGEGRLVPVNNVDAIYEEGAYGQGLFDVFQAAFTRDQRGTVTGHPYSPGQLPDAVADAGLHDSEEVLFISSQVEDVIDFLNASAVLGDYNGRGLFLTDTAANADVTMAANADRLSQVRGTRPAPLSASDPVFASFLAAYQAEYNTGVANFSYAANAYDAAWLLVYGAAWAQLNDNQINGHTIARGLRRVSAGPPIAMRPSDWANVLSLFGQGEGIDVSGASGPLNYNPVDEETLTDMEIWHVADGAPTRIYTVSPMP